MLSFLVALGILIFGSMISLLTRRWVRHVTYGSVCVGSVTGLFFAVYALCQPLAQSVRFGTPLPDLAVTFGVDPLSAFFLVALFGLALVTSLYAWGALHDQHARCSRLPFFPLLVASMAAVLTARNGVLFLVCWEIMSLTSFFLVVTDHERREVRHAGWIYLVATHLATTFLIVCFVLLRRETGSFDFHTWEHLAPLAPALAGLLFVLALVGFGTKAGIFPFHVWLPHAHPAAPSHISALMSGVMIKTGVYGLLRLLTFLGPPPLWWGVTLTAMGLCSAVMGILYALVQRDLKRLLAFSSVENVGMIVVGLGLGVIGLQQQNPLLVLLGLGGALWHVWNHTLFKGLLFLAAGSVLHATRTRMIEQLGGVLKRMPMTGLAFCVGGAAICGFPPFNGFVSEFLIYVGLFHGAQHLGGLSLCVVVAAIVGMAFAGGLAVACFAKIIGIVFLGEPRSESATIAHEGPLAMRIPLMVLGVLLLLGGLFPHAVWPGVFAALNVVAAPLHLSGADAGDPVLALLAPVAQVAALLLGLCVVAIGFHRLFYRNRRVRQGITWDCGYAAPTPRMQYTASSFTQPIAVFFRALFRPHIPYARPTGFFPIATTFAVHIADVAEQRLFVPLFRGCDRLFEPLRTLQTNRIQNSLALIFFSLIALLLWEVWFGI